MIRLGLLLETEKKLDYVPPLPQTSLGQLSSGDNILCRSWGLIQPATQCFRMECQPLETRSHLSRLLLWYALWMRCWV